MSQYPNESESIVEGNNGVSISRYDEDEHDVTKSEEDLEYKDKVSLLNEADSFNIKRLLKRAFFKCSICGEIQNTDDALQRHSYKHILQQQYSCHFCNFSCRNKEEIRDHLIEHLPIFDMSEVGK
ncbi:unnamed protein product [Nezara viridula]|uniref:C2H2-type domain-containing protein n=1 Tax=Nezara viridula TaxID=85310 RepID=A0A9P0E946_NEZVI|nr:unnamed protein product [Nezara viridula]